MAALSKVRLIPACRVAAIGLFDKIFGRRIPRRCMVFSAGLILAGLSVPLLMAIGCLPATFPLGLLGWALVFLGGYRLLTRCGEL